MNVSREVCLAAKNDMLTQHGKSCMKLAQLLTDGVQLDPDEQISLENHVLIVQRAILQTKNNALKHAADTQR